MKKKKDKSSDERYVCEEKNGKENKFKNKMDDEKGSRKRNRINNKNKKWNEQGTREWKNK